MKFDKVVFVILVISTIFISSLLIYGFILENVSDENLAGADINQNGIRDDVEDYINQNLLDPWERAALLQYAKNIQLQILSRDNPEESARLTRKNDYLGCAYYVFKQTRSSSYSFYETIEELKLEEVILNTQARRTAYDQYNSNIPSGVYDGPEESLDQCEFIEDPTSNWQTYRNEEYGFEFKYPAEFEISQYQIHFIVREKGKSYNLEGPESMEMGVSILPSDPGGSFKGKVISRNNVFYAIGRDLISETLFNQILSTFRFIDPIINSYQSCVAAGNAIIKTKPPKCESSEGLTFVEYEVCIQVITQAKNPKTGEIREFPTPCDVPEGWEKV